MKFTFSFFSPFPASLLHHLANATLLKHLKHSLRFCSRSRKAGGGAGIGRCGMMRHDVATARLGVYANANRPPKIDPQIVGLVGCPYNKDPPPNFESPHLALRKPRPPPGGDPIRARH